MFLNGGMLVHNLSVAAVEPPLPQFKPSQMLSMKIYICTPQRSTIGGLLLEIGAICILDSFAPPNHVRHLIH
jgi:hypothetical protein